MRSNPGRNSSRPLSRPPISVYIYTTLSKPNLLEEACKDKGKQKVFEFEIGTCSKPS